MQLLVRTFPILPGREEQLREFVAELQQRRSEQCADFFGRHGVARETWHLQVNPGGTWVTGVTQFPEKPIEVAGREYAASQHPFDLWFKQQVKLVTGIDPDTTPLGPPTECIFDTESLTPSG